MKKLTIYETFEGNIKNLVDINIGGEILKDIPYFDKDGNMISYDEALELYGFEGLSQNIWDDKNYIKHIINYLQKNHIEIKER